VFFAVTGRLVDMTKRAALHPVTRGRPRVPLESTVATRSSNGHHAPKVTKQPDTPLNRPGVPRRVRSRTAVRQRPDAQEPYGDLASGRFQRWSREGFS
jgi:hypothetical protein